MTDVDRLRLCITTASPCIGLCCDKAPMQHSGCPTDILSESVRGNRAESNGTPCNELSDTWPAPQVLAISGCAGATSEIWAALHAPGVPQLPLQTLSAVGCKRLRSCWLGLRPASGRDGAAQEALLSVGMYSPPVSISTSWQETPVALTGKCTPPTLFLVAFV